MNKNKKNLMIAVLILILVIIFSLTFRDSNNKFNTRAKDFLKKLYNVSYSDGEELFSQGSPEEGEWVQQLDEYLSGKYGDLLTEACYDRLVANRTLGSVHFTAYQKQSDFKIKSISFKEKQEKDGEDYYVYTIDLVEYSSGSEDILNEWPLEASISFARENGELKIRDLKISDNKYMSLSW